MQRAVVTSGMWAPLGKLLVFAQFTTQPLNHSPIRGLFQAPRHVDGASEIRAPIQGGFCYIKLEHRTHGLLLRTGQWKYRI